MSARAGILRTPNLEEAPARPIASTRTTEDRPVEGWGPSGFAKEQIRGLVRYVFFSSGEHPVRQVVINSAGPGMDLTPICELVGRTLALETRAAVAVVGNELARSTSVHTQDAETTARLPGRRNGMTLRQTSIQAANNLWLVPAVGFLSGGEECDAGTPWQSQMADLRREFEYSIVSVPFAGTSSDPALIGRFADGIILVLEAHNTRRAIARKIIETLDVAQIRVLGIVLSGRTFPLPEWIYRRL